MVYHKVIHQGRCWITGVQFDSSLQTSSFRQISQMDWGSQSLTVCVGHLMYLKTWFHTFLRVSCGLCSPHCVMFLLISSVGTDSFLICCVFWRVTSTVSHPLTTWVPPASGTTEDVLSSVDTYTALPSTVDDDPSPPSHCVWGKEQESEDLDKIKPTESLKISQTNNAKNSKLIWSFRQIVKFELTTFFKTPSGSDENSWPITFLEPPFFLKLKMNLPTTSLKPAFLNHQCLSTLSRTTKPW